MKLIVPFATLPISSSGTGTLTRGSLGSLGSSDSVFGS